MPGGVYGPNDHSGLGGQLRQAAEGRLRALTFGDLGMNMAHVDDIAAGIHLVGTRGRIGEVVRPGWRADHHGRARAPRRGRRRPAATRLATPTWLVRAAAPLGRLAGQNVREVVTSAAGVTFWATDAKARRELGYAPRDLESGLTATFGRRLPVKRAPGDR